MRMIVSIIVGSRDAADIARTTIGRLKPIRILVLLVSLEHMDGQTHIDGWMGQIDR